MSNLTTLLLIAHSLINLIQRFSQINVARIILLLIFDQEFTLSYIPRLFELLVKPALSLEIYKCLTDLALIEETLFVQSSEPTMDKRSSSISVDKSFDLSKNVTEHIVDSEEKCQELLSLVNKQMLPSSSSSLLCRILNGKQELQIGSVTSSSLQVRVLSSIRFYFEMF